MDRSSALQQLHEFDREHSKEGPGIWVRNFGCVIFPNGACRTATDISGLAGWVSPQPTPDLHRRARLILAYWEETVAQGIARFETLRAALRGNGHVPAEFMDPVAAERELRRLRDLVRANQSKVEAARAEVERRTPQVVRAVQNRESEARASVQALRDVAAAIRL